MGRRKRAVHPPTATPKPESGDRISGIEEARHADESGPQRISDIDIAKTKQGIGPAASSRTLAPVDSDEIEVVVDIVESHADPVVANDASAPKVDPGTPASDVTSEVVTARRSSIAPTSQGDPPIMMELGLHAGALVADTYRILRPLGAGGMGVVTLAHDELLDRDVAIKFIRPELFKHESLRELFNVEARAMARVSHANVLTVHALGEHEGIPYFVMEYVDGPTVEQWLASRAEGAFPDLDEALRIVEQTCNGVEAIHAAATVHRDLKPSNLLIDANLRVAVSDLGVARILEDSGGRQHCCIVGSAAYMAPEAALGDDSKPELATRRDIYALGCIAYELLTGRPPFHAPTDMGLMAKHLLEIPRPPSSVRPGLATAYDAVILRALDKDPHRRWSTVESFRRAMERARMGETEPDSILIADDDDAWCKLLHDALQPRFPDAHIDVVTDGEAAVAAFEKHPYSVVLIDLEMPELDGMRATSRLRSMTESEETPIIVLTAAGGPGEWRRLSAIGADAFLVKPCDIDDVAALIRRTLRSRHQKALKA